MNPTVRRIVHIAFCVASVGALTVSIATGGGSRATWITDMLMGCFVAMTIFTMALLMVDPA